MKRSLLVLGIFLLSAGLLVAPAVAEENGMSAPVFPMQIYGTAVDVNGNLLPVGTVITATVDGITSEYTITEAGKIGEAGTFGTKFLVQGETEGSPVIFAVNGVKSEQTASFGSNTLLELSKVKFDVDASKLGVYSDGAADSVNPVKVSSSSSSHRGTSTILSATEAPTVTPTATPTVVSPSVPLIATASQTSQPTQASPAPFVGLIAGLGAAALILTSNRRK